MSGPWPQLNHEAVRAGCKCTRPTVPALTARGFREAYVASPSVPGVTARGAERHVHSTNATNDSARGVRSSHACVCSCATNCQQLVAARSSPGLCSARGAARYVVPQKAAVTGDMTGVAECRATDASAGQRLCFQCRQQAYAQAILSTSCCISRRNLWATLVVGLQSTVPMQNAAYHSVADILQEHLAQFDTTCARMLACGCYNIWQACPRVCSWPSSSCTLLPHDKGGAVLASVSCCCRRCCGAVSQRTISSTSSRAIVRTSARHAPTPPQMHRSRTTRPLCRKVHALRVVQSARQRCFGVNCVAAMCPSGTCEARYWRLYNPTCPVPAQRKAGVRKGENRRSRQKERSQCQPCQSCRSCVHPVVNKHRERDNFRRYSRKVDVLRRKCMTEKIRRKSQLGTRNACALHICGPGTVSLAWRTPVPWVKTRHGCAASCRIRGGMKHKQRQLRYAGGGAVARVKPKHWHELPGFMQAYLLERKINRSAFTHLREQDWCREWMRWTDIQEDRTYEVMRTWVNDFLRLGDQDRNASVGSRTNAERLRELKQDGLQFHPASPDGNNCLIDSLQISLAAQSFLPSQLLDDVLARREASIACRETLIHAENPALRPRWRTADGNIQALATGQHANAYLQPDVHGVAIVRFLLDHYGNHAAAENQEFRMIACTRFDGLMVDPVDLALRIPALQASGVPGALRTLHVYNQMDAEGNSYHFDALVPERHLDALLQDKESNEVASSSSGACPGRWVPPTQSSAEVPEASGAVASQQIASDSRAAPGGTGVSGTVGRNDSQDYTRTSAPGMQPQTKLPRAGMHAPSEDPSPEVKLTAAAKEQPQPRGTGTKRKADPVCTKAEGGQTAASFSPHIDGKRKADDIHCAQPKRRRYSKKQAPRPQERRTLEKDSEADEDDGEEEDQFVLQRKAAESTKDPRAKVDRAAARVSGTFTTYVTLPTESQVCAESWSAYQLPNTHCAFASCAWTGTDDADLKQHLTVVHAEDLRELDMALRACREVKRQEVVRSDVFDARKPDALYDAYPYALGVDCQSKPPLACSSLDRRCLRRAVESLAERPPETRICMLCAQRFPFIYGSNADIRFSQLLQPNEHGQVMFWGQSAASVASCLGSDTNET